MGAWCHKHQYAMSNEALTFIYRNAAGKEGLRTLTDWREEGHYLKGFSVSHGEVRTFRKDRVTVKYLDGSDKSLHVPYSPPPPKPDAGKPADDRPQIAFTGFAKVQRAVLEAKAEENGLRVCKSVTMNLAYLCAGPNAGPTKVDKARMQDVFILSEAQLHLLLATGEIPDLDEIEC